MAAKKPRKKKGAGRPPGPPELLREEFFTLRVNGGELETIGAAAQAAGLPVGTWARDTLLRAAGHGRGA